MLLQGGGGWFICSAHSFQKVSQKESCSKQNDFSLQHQGPESRQISLEEIRYIFFFLFFFFISFCSISSIWCPLLLVSPSNMWKMYSTMQSRWLGHHLLSHRSVLCIPTDAFQNQKTILLGASERGNENEKMDQLMQPHRGFMACPPLATCLVWSVLKDPRPGPGACRKSRRVWALQDFGRCGQPFVLFSSLIATWK